MQQRKINIKVILLTLAMSTILLYGFNVESAPEQNLEARVSKLEIVVAALQAEVASQETQIATLQSDLTSAEGTIATLQSDLAAVQSNNALALDPYVTVDTNEINALTGPHIIFTGVNVHVRSGSGTTWDGDFDGNAVTGLGNLVVGYNELRDPPPSLRGGSHGKITQEICGLAEPRAYFESARRRFRVMPWVWRPRLRRSSMDSGTG